MTSSQIDVNGEDEEGDDEDDEEISGDEENKAEGDEGNEEDTAECVKRVLLA